MNIQVIIGGQSTESPWKYLVSIKYVLEEMLEIYYKEYKYDWKAVKI